MANTKANTKDLRVFLGIWAGIFAVFCLSGIILHGVYRFWAIAGLGIALALQAYPRSSLPLYIAQVKLGNILGWCISRAALVVLFVCVFVPLGLFFTLIGRDVLAPKLESHSYFIKREKQPTSMQHQF